MTFDEGTLLAARAQLIEDEISFIVPADQYDISEDYRLLIPYLKHDKFGFLNKNAEYVTDAIYDRINGNILSDSDLIKVGIDYALGYNRKNSDPWTGIRTQWDY